MTTKKWVLVGAAAALSALIGLVIWKGPTVRRMIPVNMEGRSMVSTGVDFAARPTVILFGSPTCKACTASIGFYKELAQLDVQMVAVGPSEEKVRAYYDANGIRVDKFLPISRQNVRIFPTLLVVGLDGKVALQRTGFLGSTGRQSVFDAITGLCGSCKL